MCDPRESQPVGADGVLSPGLSKFATHVLSWLARVKGKQSLERVASCPLATVLRSPEDRAGDRPAEGLEEPGPALGQPREEILLDPPSPASSPLACRPPAFTSCSRRASSPRQQPSCRGDLSLFLSSLSSHPIQLTFRGKRAHKAEVCHPGRKRPFSLPLAFHSAFHSQERRAPGCGFPAGSGDL